MEWFPPGLGRWVLQPLLDAGLSPEQVRNLVVRLAFEDVVHGDGGTVGSVHAVVRDQPVEVQDAWARVVGRLLALG